MKGASLVRTRAYILPIISLDWIEGANYANLTLTETLPATQHIYSRSERGTPARHPACQTGRR